MIQVEQESGVAHLTIARPEKRNALTRAMYQALADALDLAADDESVHAIVISGQGGQFTAGNDLDDFRARATADNPEPSAGLAFIERLMACDTPVIAAVEGLAIGIGTTLLLHCDWVVAAESAVFRTPFVDLGLCPEAASTVTMPLHLGFRQAAGLLLMGETLTAVPARDCGLVSVVVADGEATVEALARARDLARKPRQALRTSKRLLKAPWQELTVQALNRERDTFADRLRSDDCRRALDRLPGGSAQRQ
ncbi:MAG: enoyl-CoA hydratase-related protein [Marinobacter sp.]|uniref:enoyl-CoA hydratase/isomerase family protein n=1 Tax=Marinobacter sp. TaxID=50741 RepID=UPI00299E190A|nr:enoyl-CoA hydratase-related protein [Marinobacter sp.]MDX1633964.1 enoyl-CoA hydratase-related protein [Marinobacter sp.]